MELLDSSIFELASIAMWLEDFSEVKKQFDLWWAQGIQDLQQFLFEDKSRVLECARKIKILQHVKKPKIIWNIWANMMSWPNFIIAHFTPKKWTT